LHLFSQVNGVNEVDVREAKTPEQWERLSQLLLAQGVTSWYPTFVSESLAAYPKMLEEVRNRESKEKPKSANSDILLD